MKKTILTYYCLSFSLLLAAQYFQGSIDENHVFSVQPIQYEGSISRNQADELQQIQGFPIGFPADQNAKNFRNVTLQDLDFDGIPEILFAAKDKLFAYSKGSLLWSKQLTGIGIYPPSVADLDGDGTIEIVQTTGVEGRIYLMDANGNDWEGWPKSYEDHWILAAATLADLDEDGILEIIFLERISSSVGQIHALRLDGTLFNNNWPVPVPGTPAVTPSVGDVDQDGEKEIIVNTTTVMYQFDLEGELEPGWPIENPDTRFSFQAPILRDLDGNGTLEIIGAAHGNAPEYYIVQHDGTPYKNWPIPVPQQSWTFSSPTVLNMDGEWNIFMGRPHFIEEEDGICLDKDMLYGWDESGNLLSGFPIRKLGGLSAGMISVADIDEGNNMELIFGSTTLDTAGMGFIHAYGINGIGEVEGFPLRVQGWTISNGVALEDVTGDGQLNLIALSYTTNFGQQEDSIFLNIFDVEIDVTPDQILWSTFKGSNTRDGLSNDLSPTIPTSISDNLLQAEVVVFPNPITSNSQISIQLNHPEKLVGELLHLTTGKRYITLFSEQFSLGSTTLSLPEIPSGAYIIRVTNQQNHYLNRKIMVVNQ